MWSGEAVVSILLEAMPLCSNKMLDLWSMEERFILFSPAMREFTWEKGSLDYNSCSQNCLYILSNGLFKATCINCPLSRSWSLRFLIFIGVVSDLEYRFILSHFMNLAFLFAVSTVKMLTHELSSCACILEALNENVVLTRSHFKFYFYEIRKIIYRFVIRSIKEILKLVFF